MSCTRNHAGKKGRYPIKKTCHGASADHQPYSQVKAFTLFRNISTNTRNADPAMANRRRFGIPGIRHFPSAGSSFPKITPAMANMKNSSVKTIPEKGSERFSNIILKGINFNEKGNSGIHSRIFGHRRPPEPPVAIRGPDSYIIPDRGPI